MNAWFGRVGSSGALPDGKPSVWLITSPSWTEEDAKLVAVGCEEEGVPLAWDVKPGSAADLAREACLRSHLEVGIGIGEGKEAAIALVHVSDRPYVTGSAERPGELRWFGQAAARISKSQPVPGRRAEEQPKENHREQYQNHKNREQPEPDIAEIVRAVMSALSASGQDSGKEGGRT